MHQRHVNYKPIETILNFTPLLKSDAHQFSVRFPKLRLLVLPSSQVLIQFEEPKSAKVNIMIIEA